MARYVRYSIDPLMHGNSSPITSSQTGIHEHLSAIVTKHAATEFQKPITDYNRVAFDQSMTAWRAAGMPPLILDAGCGVGLSTLHLAARNPDHFVIGVDQSAHRLARNTSWHDPAPPNFVRVRADLVDYWRLMLIERIHPARHYLFYPNPWPKSGHLTRRWHGHAVFPAIVKLGGHLECRSNWRIYVEEFAAALTQLTGKQIQSEPYFPTDCITPFEKKYVSSAHALWRCRTCIVPSGV